MRNFFVFGGVATHELDMRIEHFPRQGSPARRRQTIHVPGRNGDLHYQENSFDNYVQPYECYFHGKHPTPKQAHALKAWLLRSGDYQRLQDSYDPEHFRMATFAGPLDVENILNKYGRCVVNFDCDPRSFLTLGELPVAYDAAGTIYNPTAFVALPLITVYGNGAGTVTVGSSTVKIHAMTGHLILDSELQNAYRQTGEGTPVNQNGQIYAPEFPELLPGDNLITFSGGVTKIEIIPRWWEL